MANFVYNGLLFETITVQRRVFAAFGDTTEVEAVTLESVADALGTGVVTGADTAARLAELEKFWDQSEASPSTDTFQSFLREGLSQRVPLISGKTAEHGNPGTMAQLHQLSWQWILPQGISSGINAIPDAAADAPDARNRILVASLEARHDNIRKHATATSAWAAYRSYEIAREAGDELSHTTSGYLLNPAQS